MQDSNATPTNTEQASAPAPSQDTSSTPTMTIDQPKKGNGLLIAILAVVVAVAVVVVCLFVFLPGADNKDGNTNDKPTDVAGGDTTKTNELEPISVKYYNTSITLYGTFGETVKALSGKYHIMHYVSDGGMQGQEEDIKDIDSYLKQNPKDSYEKLSLGFSENRPTLGLELYPVYDEKAKTLAELSCGLWVNVNLWADGDQVYFDEIGPFKANMTAEDMEKLPTKFTKKESSGNNEFVYTAEYKNRDITVTIYDYSAVGDDNEVVIRIN